MRRLIVLVSVVCALSAPAWAQVPSLIRYQGSVVDSNGVPLEGPYDLTLRLYDAETGGTKVYEERHNQVAIAKGQFSVLLGNGVPAAGMSLPALSWSAPCWISIQVNTDPELAPRQRITSVPLALRAGVAEQLTVPVTTSTITDDANRLVPIGAIVLWTGAACPAGYTRLSSMDNKFLVSGSAFNPAAGGSNTHSHGAGSYAGPSHTHTVSSKGWGSPGVNNTSNPPGWIRLMNAGSWGGSIDGSLDTNKETSAAGTGSVTGTSASADSRPEFATVLLCQRN